MSQGMTFLLLNLIPSLFIVSLILLSKILYQKKAEMKPNKATGKNIAASIAKD
jgi:hypothetical protein